MSLQSLSHALPSIESAVEPAIVVSPDQSVLDAITLMHQTQGNHCVITHHLAEQPAFSETRPKSSVLVMSQSQIVGIFTERDLVRLTTSRTVLANMAIAEVMSTPVVTLTQTGDETLFTALSMFRQYQIRHLPLLNSQGELLGIVTNESIRYAMQPFNLLKWRRVEDVMSPDVISAPHTATVLEVVQCMTEHEVSCIVVTKNFIPVGILTERDIVQFQALQLEFMQLPVEAIMSTPLFVVYPSDSLLFAYQEMQQRRIRRLIVVGKHRELLGIVTQSNMLRVLDPIEMYGVVEVLQQSVEERTAELELALKKQEALNELKSRFVSMASHDLRNPLSAILCATDLVEAYGQRGETAKQSICLERIRFATRHMHQLLNDLLVLGQVEAGKLELEPSLLDLKEFCQDLITELQLGTETSHEIRFTANEIGYPLSLDEKLLRQILTNLLSNGIKYSPHAPTIDFQLKQTEQTVVFTIQDYGIGIPLTDQPQLFESFHRGSNVGGISGTGLGLAIVHRCVTLHQGTIECKSEPGVGTLFTVTLPVLSSLLLPSEATMVES